MTLVAFLYDGPAPDREIGKRRRPLEGSAGEWKEATFIISPADLKRPRGKKGKGFKPDILLPSEANFWKVGFVLFDRSVGRIELDRVELSPFNPFP